MEGITLDLTRLALLWMAATVVAIPILGWTIRLTVDPVVRSLARWRTDSTVTELEQRLSHLEAELDRLRSPISR